MLHISGFTRAVSQRGKRFESDEPQENGILIPPPSASKT